MATQIHWFPGHMKKALNEIGEKIKIVDVVIELFDARAPISSINEQLESIIKNKKKLVVLTKPDLADPVQTQKWKEHLLTIYDELLVLDLTSNNASNEIAKAVTRLGQDKWAKDKARGMKPQPIRAMILGIPNVGKSSLINKIAKRKAAGVQNKPGYTRGEQWIKVNNDFLLLDTPGVLPMNYEDKRKAANLALLGSIREDILPNSDLVHILLEYLKENYPNSLKDRFSIDEITSDEEKEYKGSFPSVNSGDSFAITDKKGEQKFTQAPAHYTEAKLVKIMEELGIGRPSTYATTIKTLSDRKYVTNNRGTLIVTEQGSRTAHVLDKYFPDLVSADYTAGMEEKLDNVFVGAQSRVQTLSEFYDKFEKDMGIALKMMYEDEPVPTGKLCPKCGAPLVYKEGKNGQFVGCSNYPKCKYVEKEEKEVEYIEGRVCPQCGSPLVKRIEKKTGKPFIACSSYPKCKYIEQEEIVYTEKDYVKPCPKCGGHLVKKRGKYGYFLGCTNYPDCTYMEKIKKFKKSKRK